MVDAMHITADQRHHTVELVLERNGGLNDG
jgi:hypothetical protein